MTTDEPDYQPYEPYEPKPELVPYSEAVQSLPVSPDTAPTVFGSPVVAVAPSATMQWHLASASSAPQDPGPVHAATPTTFGGPAVDPASVPTPVSQSTAFAYQSMPSPSPYSSVLTASPYASAPAQGMFAAPYAQPYPTPAPLPYQVAVNPSDQGAPMIAGHGLASDPTVNVVRAINGAGLSVSGVLAASRVIKVVVSLVTAGLFTMLASSIGGAGWWIAGLAWVMALVTIVQSVWPGMLPSRRRA